MREVNSDQEAKAVIENARKAITLIESHNEEQRVISRMNAPLITNINKWIADMEVLENPPESLLLLLPKVKLFIEGGEGLEDTKLLIKEILVEMTKSKMEELDAYKH